jgi:hypothetical protein
MSQDLKINEDNSAAKNDAASDEIDLIDLVKNIWSQRGLVLGFVLIAVLAVLSFHAFKASFSIPSRIDYPIALSFLTDNELSYPDGMLFSPRDLITRRVLQNTIEVSGVELTMASLEKSITVATSNSILKQSENKISSLLADAKTPEEIRLTAEKSLQDLKQTGSGYITVTLDFENLNINSQQGSSLLQVLVDEWAKLSIERGLMNVGIVRPMVPFSIGQLSNSIENYDQASNYLNSLKGAVVQLSNLSGSSSLVVNNMSIEDVQIQLTALGERDIGPLRQFAYSNSSSLASIDPAMQVRLLARQRLLDLEHSRLTKLISSYDVAMTQLGLDNKQQQYLGRSDNSQGNAGQFDQSFFDSLLQLGTKIGAVDIRKQLFDRRLAAVEKLLFLEKEIAILSGTSLSGTSGDKAEKINADVILKGALVAIESNLNEIQYNIGQFVDAIRERTFESHAQVYIANSAPQVRGDFMQLAPRFTLFVILGAVLGLFLGIFVALIRSALLKSK